MAKKNENDKSGAMALKTCRVSCHDLLGIEHAVDVSASSLYEEIVFGAIIIGPATAIPKRERFGAS
jgi:hypothetical protein